MTSSLSLPIWVLCRVSLTVFCGYVYSLNDGLIFTLAIDKIYDMISKLYLKYIIIYISCRWRLKCLTKCGRWLYILYTCTMLHLFDDRWLDKIILKITIERRAIYGNLENKINTLRFTWPGENTIHKNNAH